MPLRDFLVPEEQIKIICKRDVEYANKKYSLFVTNKRILLYKKRGILNKTEDVVCEKLERLEGLEYKEKRGLCNLAKISIKGGLKISIKGPTNEVKNVFQVLELLDELEVKVKTTLTPYTGNSSSYANRPNPFLSLHPSLGCRHLFY